MSDNKDNKFKKFGLGTWLTWIGLALFAFLAIKYFMFDVPAKALPQISYSKFWALVEEDKVKEVTINGQLLTAVLTVDYEKMGSKIEVVVPEDGQFALVERLREEGIDVQPKVRKEGSSGTWLWILFMILPMVFIFWIFRRMSGQAGFTQQFSKARTKQDRSDVRFDDVAGCDEAKEELKEVIEFLKKPKKFARLGAKIPKGVLLVGPPGTGKTLLARAVAGEAGVPFLTLSGSDFVEMFVGVGASRVRDLFETAKKAAPCIIFIDEIDAVGRHRGAGLGHGNDEREQTLNALFVEMDGFAANIGIIVMAATNRPDVLDPALLRPGRFDRHVTVGLPDLNGREAVLQVHVKDKVLADDVNLREIARGTPMFSGADLYNLVNEAALLAARQDKDAISRDDFEKAKDRIIMGLEKKGFKMTKREREITAYHEAGHTLVAKMLPGADPIHKVSIIPRGRALGVTSQLPEEDRYIAQKSYMLCELAILMGGRAAELIKFGETSSGASNDIQVVTSKAQVMVCKLGMSEKLGTVAWGKEAEDIFLGRQIVQSRGYSEQTAQEIDEEVKSLVADGLKTAKKIIEENLARFEALASALLLKETLDGEEVRKILADNPPQ